MHYTLKIFIFFVLFLTQEIQPTPVIMLIPDNNTLTLSRTGIRVIAESLRTAERALTVLCTESPNTETEKLINTINQNSSRITLVIIISALSSPEQKITYINYNNGLVPPLDMTTPLQLPIPYNSAHLIANRLAQKITARLMQYHQDNPSIIPVSHLEFPVSLLKGYTVPTLLIECTFSESQDWRVYSTIITNALTQSVTSII